VSFTFTIPTTRFPAPAAILDAVGREGLVWMEDEPVGEEWPQGTLHVGVRDRAARGVEISREEGGLGVRILACSSLEDFDLALRFVDAFARACGDRVQPEDVDAPLPAEHLRSRYGDAWIASETSGTTGSLRTMVERDGGVYEVWGLRRVVHVGPRTVARLPRPSQEFQRGAALLEVVRRVQWIDEARWFPAGVFRVKGQLGRTGRPRTVAMWGKGVALLLPGVDAYVIDAEPVLEVDASHLEEVAGDRFVEWLDDRQALVEAASGDTWRALVERARHAARAPARRPWWRLWGGR
jgi:hypothetical protein